jgi:hypothetical protein
MKNKYFMLFILSFLCFSCENNTYNDVITKKINYMLQNENDNYDYVVIIPGSGCTGCITNAETYFLNHVANNSIKFVFTAILSKKTLQLRLQKENLNRKNVFIDNSNSFYLHGFHEKNYPVIAKISNKKVINVDFLGGSPD